MAKKTKAINTKEVAKQSVLDVINAALADAGFTTVSPEDFGFKKQSIVLTGVEATDKDGNIVAHDIRVDLTAPKAGQDTYDYAKEKYQASLVEADEAE